MLFPLGKSFLFLAASIYVLAVCRNFYVSTYNPLNTKQSNIKINKQIQSKPHQYYIKRIGQGQYRLFNLIRLYFFIRFNFFRIFPLRRRSFYVHCFLTLLLKKFTYVSFFYYQERIIVLKKKLKRRKK